MLIHRRISFLFFLIGRQYEIIIKLKVHYLKSHWIHRHLQINKIKVIIILRLILTNKLLQINHLLQDFQPNNINKRERKFSQRLHTYKSQNRTKAQLQLQTSQLIDQWLIPNFQFKAKQIFKRLKARKKVTNLINYEQRPFIIRIWILKIN